VRRPHYFVFGLPLTMLLMTFAANKALYGSEKDRAAQTPPPPPMTAKRLYGDTREQFDQEFGEPSYVMDDTANRWYVYCKDNTEVHVRFGEQGRANVVMATNRSPDTSGETLIQNWPPISEADRYGGMVATNQYEDL
jgi:hypothetical protein